MHFPRLPAPKTSTTPISKLLLYNQYQEEQVSYIRCVTIVLVVKCER